ncbi:alpha/beta hydrolase [Lewinella cohaerens]|uniref:alpha/beta hydrolase n=1 Tax=Lewinella cohaerens TaxID=70995 RepID=UPI00035F26EC|nr:alpha/beta hydrolase [Lewinella cohaerens]
MKLKSLILLFVISHLSTNYCIAQISDFPAPGELFDNGGYKMHLLIEGKNKTGPNVIFFHGAGDIALNWNLVLPKVGQFATAVAIDQNGEGWSEHGHGAALNQQVYDSRQVLRKAGINPPYIVVGHSLGGIIANLFAVEFKDEIAGVVLVDATHPDVVLKIYNKESKKMEWKKMRLTANDSIPPVITTPITTPKEISSFQGRKDFGNKLDKFSEEDKERFQWIYNLRPWTYIKGQADTYEAEIFQMMYENYEDYSLSELPLIVITGGAKEPKEGDENWSSESLMNHSISLQKNLLTLSSNSEQIIAKNSGHHIHIDEPEVVVVAIKKLINDANKK